MNKLHFELKFGNHGLQIKSSLITLHSELKVSDYSCYFLSSERLLIFLIALSRKVILDPKKKIKERDLALTTSF